jgi:hypothetical protein
MELSTNSPSPSLIPRSSPKPRNIVVSLLGILIVVGLIGAGVYYFGSFKPVNKNASVNTQPVASSQPEALTKTKTEEVLRHSYINALYGYSYVFPDGFEVKGSDDGVTYQQVNPMNKASIVIPQKGADSDKIFATQLVEGDFTEATIRRRWEGKGTLTLESLLINQAGGYKVTVSGQSDATYYYVKNHSGRMIEIMVRNNDKAKSVFDNFKVVK